MNSYYINCLFVLLIKKHWFATLLKTGFHHCFYMNFAKFQSKQSPASEKRCSQKFYKIHKKTPVAESLFYKTLLKMRLWHRCFPLNFVKFRRTPFLTEHLRWCDFVLNTALIINQNFDDNRFWIQNWIIVLMITC